MPEIRNPTTNETPTQTTDRMAGGVTGNHGAVHPSAPGGAGPAKFVNPSTAPTSKGNYGAPMDKPIFGGNS